MKRRLILLTVLIAGFISIQASGSNKNLDYYTNNSMVDCSGEFKIDGKSYTITLHDVSVWTCMKFKIVSLFN